MKDLRAFTYTNESYYFNEKHLLNKSLHEIFFGIYSEDEEGNDRGCVAEMSFRWYDLTQWHDRDKSLTPKLEVFNDGWKALATFSDLIQELAKNDSKNLTPQEMMIILKKLGFKDKTKRVA